METLFKKSSITLLPERVVIMTISRSNIEMIFDGAILDQIRQVPLSIQNHDLATLIARDFKRELHELVDIYLRLGNVAAARAMFEPRPGLGAPLVPAVEYLNQQARFTGRSTEQQVARILKDAASNSYHLCLMFMEYNLITPEQLLSIASRNNGRNVDSMLEAAEDYKRPGFRAYAAGEPAYRDGIYPAASEDRSDKCKGLLNIREILNPANPNDIPASKYHPLLRPAALEGLENIDTRGIRAEDLAALAGESVAKYSRDTVINDINGAISKACSSVFCSMAGYKNLEAVRVMAEMRLFDIARPFSHHGSLPQAPIMLGSQKPELAGRLVELGADPKPLLRDMVRCPCLGLDGARTLRAVLDSIVKSERAGFDFNSITAPVQGLRFPLLAAAAHQCNAEFVAVVSEYAKLLNINPNISAPDGRRVLDIAIDAKYLLTDNPVLRAIRGFPGIKDERPFGDCALFRAINALSVEGVRAALECCDPAQRNIANKSHLDIAAGKLFAAQERNSWLHNPAQKLLSLGQHLLGERPEAADAEARALQIMEILQNDARVQGRPAREVAHPDGNYASLVELQETVREINQARDRGRNLPVR